MSAPVSAWARAFQVSRWVLRIGAILGCVALLLRGRELTNAELGVFLWPLVTLYLVSFFYAIGYIVFTEVKGRMRFVVIPLWVIMMCLLTGGFLAMAFSD